MKSLVLVSGLAIFALVSLAVRFHFRSEASPRSFQALAVASGVNIFVFGRELWLHQKSAGLLSVALVLMVASAMLFAWALSASRSARLKLIFDPDQPQFVLRAGPYARIRHPFYASYILFWLGCAVATLNPLNIAYIVMLVALLTFAARTEERGFDGTPLAAEYAAYRRVAGLFWPKLGARS